jgi:hypothetical protein
MSSDIVYVKTIEKELPGYLWYLVGVMQIKTSLSIQVVGNFLKKVHQDFIKHRVCEEAKNYIEELLYEGKLGDAKNYLESYINDSANYNKNIENDVLGLIAELRNDAAFYQQIELKLKPQSSFNCSFCAKPIFSQDLAILDDCPHMFHKECISIKIRQQIASNALKIICPVNNCTKEIQFHYLEHYVNKEEIRKYQEGEFERMVKSGQFGKVITCPNITCKVQFCAELDKGYCPKCGVSICGVCLKMLDYCLCNQVVVRRQCPFCGTWNDKGQDKVLNCTKCASSFCFNCLKRSTECRCRGNQ